MSESAMRLRFYRIPRGWFAAMAIPALTFVVLDVSGSLSSSAVAQSPAPEVAPVNPGGAAPKPRPTDEPAPDQPVAETAAAKEEAVSPADPPASAEPTVKINLTGITSKKGTINVAVFTKPKGFPDQKFASHTQSVAASAAKKGAITIEIAEKHFPADKPFAIGAYHDTNGDGKLNKSGLGRPTESYGFTNNARATFGPPKYKKALLPAIDPATGPHTFDVKIR